MLIIRPKSTMATAKDVANVFLKLSQPEVGDVITNLKIQKLVYYAQGFHLALYGKTFFNEDIVNWEHGPVVVDLYHDFKSFGQNPIPIPEEDIPEDLFSSEQMELLEEISQVYGQFSAWKLRNMTHEERPWKETSRGDVIPLGLMEEYFKTQLAS